MDTKRINSHNGCAVPYNMPHSHAASEGCCNLMKYPSLAMVYSPFQVFDNLFMPTEALKKGTLFCELDKPFCGTCSGIIMKNAGCCK